jgi:hypothetical protein
VVWCNGNCIIELDSRATVVVVTIFSVQRRSGDDYRSDTPDPESKARSPQICLLDRKQKSVRRESPRSSSVCRSESHNSLCAHQDLKGSRQTIDCVPARTHYDGAKRNSSCAYSSSQRVVKIRVREARVMALISNFQAFEELVRQPEKTNP